MYHSCNSYGGDGGSTRLIPHEKIRMPTSTGNATHGDAITALLSKRHQVSGNMQISRVPIHHSRELDPVDLHAK